MFTKTKKFIKEEKTVIGAFVVGAAVATGVAALATSGVRMRELYRGEFIEQTGQYEEYMNWIGK
jgi:hypothetical protein